MNTDRNREILRIANQSRDSSDTHSSLHDEDGCVDVFFSDDDDLGRGPHSMSKYLGAKKKGQGERGAMNQRFRDA